MISIIICSHKKEIAEKAIQSIDETIGVLYEMIVIDNSTGRLGICEAYNEGAKKATYNILCFMHEDVSFETPNWGLAVIKHLSDDKVGLLGVAGGDTKSLVPSGWASMIFKSEISMVQHYKYQEKSTHKLFETGYPDDLTFCKQVACIDGVWMCTRKDVFEKYQFDAKTQPGFHGYDIDYSLQVNQSYKVCVAFDIILHHYSEGLLNNDWLESAVRISKKWKKRLPFSVRDISNKELVRQHWTAMNVFIDKMIELDYSFPTMVYHFITYSFTRFYHFRHSLYSLKKIVLK